jgi:hypothetical protein
MPWKETNVMQLKTEFAIRSRTRQLTPEACQPIAPVDDEPKVRRNLG